MSRRRSVSSCLLAATAIGVACSDADGNGGSPRPGVDALTGSITVSAASSLADAFQELAESFETRHPEVEVTLNLAGSGALTTQILEGAPVDVFAPAAPEYLDEVADELAEPGRTFATNRLRIAVPAGNPGGVTGLADLSREELVIGLCAPGVPCGDLAREALSRAGIVARPDTREPNARALLTKVRLGEVDAALVYVSDVQAGGPSVEGVEMPEPWNPTALYAIGPLKAARNPRAALEFVDFVLSPVGATILARHGLGPAPGATR